MKNIEHVKRFWNDRPCNIRHSKETVGTKLFFDQVEARRYFVEPHIVEFADFKQWNNKEVLEIGCGIGTDTINFARCGANVTAIDVSSESIKIAKQRAEIYGISKNINFILGSAEELDKLIGISPRFDLIYSFGVIHHSPRPDNIIRWFQSLLADDGVIKVMLYHRYSWKVFNILMKYGKMRFWKLDDLISKYSEAQTGCPITYSYSTKQSRQLFGKFGMTVHDIQIKHVFTYKIPEYIDGKYVKHWYFRYMPDPIFKYFQKYFGWHLLIQAS